MSVVLRGRAGLFVPGGVQFGERGLVVSGESDPPNPPGPPSNFSVFANRPATLGDVTPEGNLLLAAGSFTGVRGTPQVVVASDYNDKAFRFADGDALLLPAGDGDFLSQGDFTLVFALRFRKYNYGTGYLIDSTEAETQPGFQLTFDNVNADIFKRNVLWPRVYDGSTWVLDRNDQEYVGQFIILKRHVITVQVTDTYVNVRLDGRGVLYIPRTVSFVWPSSPAGVLALLGLGDVDVFGCEGFDSILNADDISAHETYMATEFHVSMIVSINGLIDTLPSPPQPQFVAYPWIVELPDGRMSVTSFNGHNEEAAAYNYDTEQFSRDGKRWTSPTVIFQGESGGPFYADAHSLVISDGRVIRVVYTYDAITNLGNALWYTISNDGGITYPSLTQVDLTGLTFVWLAVGGAPVETAVPGVLSLPMYVLGNESDAGWIMYNLQIADYGEGAWTPYLMVTGAVSGAQYAEGQSLLHSSGELRALIRVNSVGMIAGRSADNGMTWETSDTLISAVSAGQGYIEVPLREGVTFELWAAGRPTGIQQAALYYRSPGAAWDDPWAPVPDSLYWDARPGAAAYGGVIRRGNRLFVVWAETTGDGLAQAADVTGRFIDPWVIVRQMPGSATPISASIIVGHALQLSNVKGAGGFIYAVDPNNSGGSISAAAEYTAGLTEDTEDTIVITDLNGYSPVRIIVSVIPDPNVMLNTVFPTAGIETGGTVLELTGNKFVDGSTTVHVGGIDVSASIVFTDSKHLTVVAPTLPIHDGGYDVIVTAPAGTATKVAAYEALKSTLHRHYDVGATYSRTLSGDSITSLLNILGTGDDMTPTAEAQPTLVTSGINGMPSVHNGNSPASGLSASSAAWASTAITLGGLFRTTQTTEGRIIGQQYNNYHDLFYIQGGTGLAAYNTADATTALSDNPVNDGLPHAFAATIDLAGDQTARVFIDGDVPGIVSAFSVTPINGNPNTDANCLGTSDTDPPTGFYQSYNGEYSPMFVFTSALTGSDLTAFMNYLKRNGGIS